MLGTNSTRHSGGPPALRIAATACVILGLAAVAFGVFEITQTRLSRIAVGGGTAIVMLAYGAAMFAVARGILRSNRYARGPAMAMGLVLLPVAWSFSTLGDGAAADPRSILIGVAMALLALTLTVCLVLPSSTRAFFPDRDEIDPNSSGY